jgi:uncharacterized protein YjbI with pentapeptide repeats
MANPENLAKLREGPEAWNQWRKEHADVVPDLSEADLDKANLDSADLNGVRLCDAVRAGWLFPLAGLPAKPLA